MKRKPRQILDLEIDEISLVDKGANQHAIVTIAKSANGDKENYMDIFDEQGQPVDHDELELGDVVYDADGQAYELTDEDEHEYEDERELEEVGKAKGMFANAGQAAKRFSNRQQAGLGFGRAGEKFKNVNPGAVRNRRIATGAVGAAGVGAAGYGISKSYGEELREELSKALTDADRDDVISKAFDQIEYFAEAAEIAKAAAEEERKIRLEKEYTEVAKSYDLPFDPEELGGVLMRMAEKMDYEDCEIIGKALSYASEATDYIYDEYGAIGGGDNSDVMSQVNAIVDETVSKSAGYGAEELTAEFFANNPGAYDDYLAGY